jgi:molybdopterin-guanine dinucleotide biosynthesis protein A
LKISGIVLAGGKSIRLGHDKTTEKVGNTTLIETVVSCLEHLCEEVIIVTAKERSFSQLVGYPGVRAATDIIPGQGSLGGIYTGLVKSGSFYNLIVAADMPFLNAPLLRYMIEAADGFDFVLPRVGKLFEPLHAVYSKNCVPAIENVLRQGKKMIIGIFDYVKVKYIEEAEIDRFDPRHLSFFNINTLEDLKAAKKIAGGSPA